MASRYRLGRGARLGLDEMVVATRMGEARIRKTTMRGSGAQCIFCGGAAPATTEEHCPPRGLFKDRQWPKGYAFPACGPCNADSANDDRMVAMIAVMGATDSDPSRLKQGIELLKGVHRKSPATLQQMFEPRSTSQARALARRLKMRPAPGETYQDLGIATVPDTIHAAVRTLASKLTKAIYFKQTDRILPANCGIMFQWFTNAQKLEHGSIVYLDAFASLPSVSPSIERNGQDLRDQFDYQYSVEPQSEFHVLRVVFGKMYGFVSLASPAPGKLEDFSEAMLSKSGAKESPFEFLNSNR